MVAATTTRDPSVAAEGRVLMTPHGQGPRAGVGQGTGAPKVECCVPLIASGLVEAGGEAQWSGRGEEEDACMMTAAMLLCGGRRWGDCDGEEEEVEEDNKGVTIAALGASAGKMADSMSPQRRRRNDGRQGSI
jgi:hypothetical protein